MTERTSKRSRRSTREILGIPATLPPKRPALPEEVQAGHLSKLHAETLTEKLELGELDAPHLYTLLTAPQEKTERWKNLHKGIITWLTENYEVGPSIIAEGVNAKKWTQVDHQITTCNIGDELGYQVTSTMNLNNMRYDAPTYKGFEVQEGKQIGTVSILADLLNLPLPAKPPEEGSRVQLDRELSQICNNNRLHQPSVSIHEVKTANGTRYHVIASTEIDKAVIESDEISLLSKKRATQRARRDLLKKLQDKFPRIPEKDDGEASERQKVERVHTEITVFDATSGKKITIWDSNYHQGLIDLAKHRGWGTPAISEPISTQKTKEQEFSCNATIQRGDQETLIFPATGASKKESKSNAAKNAFYALVN